MVGILVHGRNSGITNQHGNLFLNGIDVTLGVAYHAAEWGMERLLEKPPCQPGGLKLTGITSGHTL